VDEHRETPDGPRLAFAHIDDVPSNEVVAQQHGDRRVSVHQKVLEWTPQRMVALTRYDPGMIIERHGHRSDNLVYVMEGDLAVGDRPCPAGTLITLECGAVFGPLVAGPAGCLLFESWGDDVTPVPADKDGYARLLAERGVVRLPNPPFEKPPGAPATDLGSGDRWS
jgi:hypothetical protein